MNVIVAIGVCDVHHSAAPDLFDETGLIAGDKSAASGRRIPHPALLGRWAAGLDRRGTLSRHLKRREISDMRQLTLSGNRLQPFDGMKFLLLLLLIFKQSKLYYGRRAAG